jgi:hypothetical protein
MTFPDPELAWPEVPDRLLALAAGDLDDGVHPRARLAAHRRGEALAIALLRPFEPGRILDAIVELLALFVPIGADRIAFALPCRVWSTLDPIPPVLEGEGLDLRQPAIVVATADGRQTPARLGAAVHPFTCHDDGAWGWEEAVAVHDPPHASLLSALRIILDHRGELGSDRSHLRAQLERVLMLGHELALGPAAVRELPLSPLAAVVSRTTGPG